MTLAEGGPLAKKAPKNADVLIGEDWVGASESVEDDLRAGREKRGFITLRSSPLARKIITFNLIALIILVVGVLYVDPFRGSLVVQRERALVTEARLLANLVEAQLPAEGAPDLGPDMAPQLRRSMALLDLPAGVEVFVLDRQKRILATTQGLARETAELTATPASEGSPKAHLTDAFDRAFSWLKGLFGTNRLDENRIDAVAEITKRADIALAGKTSIEAVDSSDRGVIYIVSTPVITGGRVLGLVSVMTSNEEIEAFVRSEREQVLQMFLLAMIVSIGLSMVLASTIANPLSDLALAAELGRDKNARKMSPSRVRIPDLTARPDEIGRLSGALRGMVMALYDRIDSNEQFAADVAHEIKNPLASLRSAVGSLRFIKKDEQREKLLDVIDHDVRRLDRLVSDISNASRLDSELVKEDEEPFDLLRMLGHLIEFHSAEAASRGVEFISDIPKEPVIIDGLEGRLAQVFVNLITNAVSFCSEGDAVRIWVRRRDNRVLVVVEDTGPGIPEEALNKIFKRFYSERPEGQFGNHSGLGLAISKQIVEAHGGVIWAENIRPTDADITSEPLGARFVVGLPV